MPLVTLWFKMRFFTTILLSLVGVLFLQVSSSTCFQDNQEVSNYHGENDKMKNLSIQKNLRRTSNEATREWLAVYLNRDPLPQRQRIQPTFQQDKAVSPPPQSVPFLSPAPSNYGSSPAPTSLSPAIQMYSDANSPVNREASFAPIIIVPTQIKNGPEGTATLTPSNFNEPSSKPISFSPMNKSPTKLPIYYEASAPPTITVSKPVVINQIDKTRDSISVLPTEALSTAFPVSGFEVEGDGVPHCGCNSCTDDVWNLIANGYSCGDRIEYLSTIEKSVYPLTNLACSRVASIEFPNECGLCDPFTCDGKTAASNDRKNYCNCAKCTQGHWTLDAGDGLSCGAKVTWAQGHNPHYQLEVDACKLIAIQYPLTCGMECNPITCTKYVDNTNTIDQNERLSQQPTSISVHKHPTSFPSSQTSTTKNTNSVFGSNVWIMNSNNMSTAEIQGAFDDIFNKQVNNEMGTERYTIYFLPGVYGSATDPLYLKLGYYTEVAGLGANPGEVLVNGKIEVYNRCFVPDSYQEGKFIPFNGDSGMCVALNNFWRSLSNLAINIVSVNQNECRKTAMFWAISQASSMRRVDIRGGDVSLMDYCTHPAYASGGFISDSRASKIISGSQQQFISRNIDIDVWDGSVWNIMFLGVNGAPDDSTYPNPPFTTFKVTPLSREKPYIFVVEDQYYVYVPFLSKNSSGITWADDSKQLSGITKPLSDFAVVNPTILIDDINSYLADGLDLLFLPGVYDIDKTLYINRKGTVVLGIGHATLTAMQGVIAMKTADVPGIIIAGITFDAGEIESEILLQIGTKEASGLSNPNNPTTLIDIYFRVGGPHIGKVNVCLEINSNNVLIDHMWVWRADHGIELFNTTDGFEGDNERWITNTGRNGVVVNGNNVTAIGLFVEHFQEHNLIWNGENGKVYFFQSELPYDPPTQNEWMNTDGTLGWSSYKVDESVKTHELWGGGVYSYNRNNPNIQTENGFDASNTGEGISMNRLFTRNLSGPGIINAVLNGLGERAAETNPGPHYLI